MSKSQAYEQHSRTSISEEILKELKQLRVDNIKSHTVISARIKKLEQEVDLIRNEQRRQGIQVAEFILRCIRKFDNYRIDKEQSEKESEHVRQRKISSNADTDSRAK